ncbi:hypothetical protein AB0958_09805 [Streptomyces sp. NPDC006655]|uniref:hypothetical protein n=1 Tax=Streptomyces sp. NPDC006655 TaxID=3156898 RepID=UPI003452B9BA
MSHRPYPRADRARHQVDRHAKPTPALSDSERFKLGIAALRAASWTAQELVDHWQRALRPRPAKG